MNILFGKNITVKISIFIVWIFHVCGLIGIIYGNKDWFIAFTPVNLYLSFFLLFVTQNELNNKNIISAISIFLIGIIAEILGVNFGIIFGEYQYLDNLGIKIFGVPIIIGVQWILLTFITGSFSAYIFKKSKIKAVFLGAILMVLLDMLIEPVAPDMGFWVFNSLKAPVQNYIAWFVIGIIVQILFHNGIDKKEQTFSFHLLIIQFLFFGLINILAL
jgi:putative membrane protein